MKKILCIVGTRPEAIKMAPVINGLKAEPSLGVKVLATGQHRDMLDQVLKVFSITPDVDLNLMRPNQDLTTLTAKLLLGLNQEFEAEKPDVVLAQGDTTSVMAAALTSFYHRVAFGHVEAGLRTWDIHSPFPEEMNRVVTGQLTTWHFAPTSSAKLSLLREGVLAEKVYITGNTVIDAMYSVLDRDILLPSELSRLDPSKKTLLVTIHRRENFGFRFEQICRALIALLNKNPNVQVLFPVHPNPNIQGYAHKNLGAHPRVTLCDPLDYLPFIAAMKMAYMILSDSGGIQEEAPALGKPVLVLRDSTERPEAVTTGVAKLVGADHEKIIAEAQKLLDDDLHYRTMAKGGSPYGDGLASGRIISVLRQYCDAL